MTKTNPIEIRIGHPNDAQVIQNLYPLYVHDLSPFTAAQPNPFGILNAEGHVKTHADDTESLNGWWENPGSDFAYVIFFNQRPAGFALLSVSIPDIQKQHGTDFFLHEFFVLRAVRGLGVAQEAVRQMLERVWNCPVRRF